jgi:hypothetical protein
VAKKLNSLYATLQSVGSNACTCYLSPYLAKIDSYLHTVSMMSHPSAKIVNLTVTVCRNLYPTWLLKQCVDPDPALDICFFHTDDFSDLTVRCFKHTGTRYR